MGQTEVIAITISAISLGFSIYTYYISRRDKKPKLKIKVINTENNDVAISLHNVSQQPIYLIGIIMLASRLSENKAKQIPLFNKQAEKPPRIEPGQPLIKTLKLEQDAVKWLDKAMEEGDPVLVKFIVYDGTLTTHNSKVTYLEETQNARLALTSGIHKTREIKEVIQDLDKVKAHLERFKLTED